MATTQKGTRMRFQSLSKMFLILGSAFFCMALSNTIVEKHPHLNSKSKTKVSVAAPASPTKSKSATSNGIINDSWYTMQAGSTPWGYFHEIIEGRDGRYSYRYNMTKVEKG